MGRDTTSHSRSTTRAFTYEAAGRTLFAAEAGVGWPLVMFHGGLADHRAVQLLIPEPPAGVRLITPDVRGSGRSVDPGPLSWSRLADDVAALLDRLGLERAVVGGTSIGNGVAVAFALRYPNRTAGTVFVHPVHAGGGPTGALAAALDEMHAAAERAVEEGIEALRPLYARLPSELRDRAWAVAREFDPASCLASTTLYRGAEQPLADLSELRGIAVPALVVPGSDAMHPAELGEAYADSLTGATILGNRETLEPAITRLCGALGPIGTRG